MSREKGKKTRKQRPFPRNTLEEALQISKTIKDQNNGQPMRRLFIADHLGVKPESSNFRYLISSSYRYGLTEGSQQSEYLSLSTLGSDIAKTEDEKQKILYLQEACQNVEVFKNFYQRYRNSKLPTDDYAKKLLADEFKVPEEHIDECMNLILTNGRFCSIIQDVAGAPRVVFEKALTIPLEEKAEEKGEVGIRGEVPSALQPVAPKPKQIFIAHGKNKIPLEQLKGILDQFRVPYKVAIEEPHIGRPISQKVAEIMTNCSSAIFIFTADEEVHDSQGNITYRPSDNVVYELGAAGVLYGKNIVIFKEREVAFASDFRDLGYIVFEKDNLRAKATDLLKELIEFGLLRITPA